MINWLILKLSLLKNSVIDGHYTAEMLNDLISRLNRGNDPNNHTLDTLEQCMAFLLERIAGPDVLDCNSQSNYSDSSLIGIKRMPVTTLHGMIHFR